MNQPMSLPAITYRRKPLSKSVVVRACLVAVFCGWLMAVAGPPIRADSAQVDLALVVALDCSGSVDEEEFALQMKGLALAFQRPETMEAIAQGDLQRIAVSVVHWSGSKSQVTVLPWTVIATAEDARNFADSVAATLRGVDPGATAISSMLLFAEILLDQAPRANRKVIDVAADGPGNIGPPLDAVRGKLLGRGITINGLAIENEWRKLGIYMQNKVAGGADHFVVTARDYEEFADAIFRKLLKEITGPGVS